MWANSKSKVKFFLIALFCLFGLTYGLFQAREMIRGPVVEVTSPKDGDTITSPLVEIEGIVKNIAFITLNGQQIYANENGEFKEKLVAAPGTNTIIISVVDKFNRLNEEKIELFYKTPEEISQQDVVTEAGSEVIYQ